MSPALRRAVIHASCVVAVASSLTPMQARGPLAITKVLTGTICDRGIDIFPYDGLFDSVFGAFICSSFTPPAGVPGSEERPAVEFRTYSRLTPIPIPAHTKFSSAELVLTPVQGPSGNLGLAADEAVEFWVYVGDGAITVDDLNLAGKTRAGTLAGPTDDGVVTVTLNPRAFSKLYSEFNGKGAPKFLGIMVKGVPGVSPIGFSFASTTSGVPFANRPKLKLTF
jgi:hypothetical protein